MSILYWFKNDLRLHDNEALTKAINSGLPVLPVYIFDPFSYQNLDLGFAKTDSIRFTFTEQCVMNLRHNLIEIGGNLKICSGRPQQVLPELVEKYGITSIHGETEYATEEKNILKEVENGLPKHCSLQLTWGRTLYHIDDIPYEVSEIPLTSKAFRINTQKATGVRPTWPPITRMVGIEIEDWGEPPPMHQLNIVLNSKHESPLVPGGETQALNRLHYYLFGSEKLISYRWTRNRSHGLDYSSKFSPYLALGCISPRTIYEAVKKFEKEVKKNQSTWWIIFELVWRDYFTFKLMRFQNRIYHTEGYSNKILEFTNDGGLYQRWCEGKTGIPFIDAHMRQLNATGFMSNRGRVNCASFLVHDYQVDWTWGASYFESKLIDYDVGSNWMNWHAQAYQIWYTNPVHQANKYKAQEFIREWVPEIGHLDDMRILIPWESDVKNYPKPHRVFSKWGRAINKIKSMELS